MNLPRTPKTESAQLKSIPVPAYLQRIGATPLEGKPSETVRIPSKKSDKLNEEAKLTVQEAKEMAGRLIEQGANADQA